MMVGSGSPWLGASRLLPEKFRINFPVPCVKVLAHGRDSFRLFPGKVFPLSGIFQQVVEVGAAILEAFDELVATLANGSTGKTALV